MKKRLSVFLAILLLLSFAGCGQAEQGSDQDAVNFFHWAYLLFSMSSL